MNTSMMSALSTMRGLQQKIDVLSDHVANLDTVGYKRKDASFKDVLATVRNQPDIAELEGRLTPSGLSEGWGSMLSTARLDMSQGNLKETGLETDIALVGEMMLQVQRIRVDVNGNPILDANGVPANDSFFTRNGALKYTAIEADPGFKYIATAEGDILRDTQTGERLRVPDTHELEIARNGVVQAHNPNRPDAAPLYIGQLALFEILKPQSLEKLGQHLYALAEGIEAPETVAAPVNWNEPGDMSVQQRFLEQSNANLIQEMTELLSAQRAYQLNARAIVSAETMMGLANNLRG